MAAEIKDSVWPQPQFAYQITFGSVGVLHCQEISDFDHLPQVTEFRTSAVADPSGVQIPVIHHHQAIALKRSVLTAPSPLYDYLLNLASQSDTRQQVSIQLMDEQQKPLKTWKLINAFVQKVTDIKPVPGSEDVAVQEIVLAHEGITILKWLS